MGAILKFANAVDRLNAGVGKVLSLAVLAMVLIVFLIVVLRYGFSLGWVALQESYVWLHGLVFMLGAGFTLQRDGHVRVDIFYRGHSRKFRAWVNLAGTLLFLMPLVITIAWVSVPYAADSWARLEASREAGGLPGLFALKSAILVFCVLFGLQGLSLMARSVATLFSAGTAEAPPRPGEGI